VIFEFQKLPTVGFRFRRLNLQNVLDFNNTRPYGRQGRTGDGLENSKAGGIQRVKLQKSHFIKMLELDFSSYCKASNTCCMDLIFETRFFINTSFTCF